MIKVSLLSKRLKLNAHKTDFILLGTRQQLAKLNLRTIHLCGVNVPVSPTITCLGVLIDSELTFAAHVRRLTGTVFISCVNCEQFATLSRLRPQKHSFTRSLSVVWTTVTVSSV